MGFKPKKETIVEVKDFLRKIKGALGVFFMEKYPKKVMGWMNFWGYYIGEVLTLGGDLTIVEEVQDNILRFLKKEKVFDMVTINGFGANKNLWLLIL